jgi:hypothetical protein
MQLLYNSDQSVHIVTPTVAQILFCIRNRQTYTRVFIIRLWCDVNKVINLKPCFCGLFESIHTLTFCYLIPDYSLLKIGDIASFDEIGKIQFIHAKILEKRSPIKDRLSFNSNGLNFF